MTVTHIAGATAPPAQDYDADIVILALDRVDETIAAIASALAQTGASRHVVVLDQGSLPGNLARLAACVDGRTDATLLRSDVNLGVAGGRNLASAFGRGTAIVALDNDAEFATPATLQAAVAALAADHTLAAIGFRIVLFDGGADDLSSWGYPPALLAQAAASFDAATFVGAGHAIRRTAWQAAEGYDARLFFCWEEYDFCLRAIDLGWRVRYRGDIAVRHKVSAERRVDWSGNRWFHFVRNRLYIERKWQAGWLALAPRLAGYLVKAARHGLVRRTVLAAIAAERLARGTNARPRSPASRAYLQAHDQAYRGSLLDRLRSEVLAALPGTAKVRISSSAPP